MGTATKDLARRLRDFAMGQQGYFTAKQAVDLGYVDVVHGYHVARGNWERVIRGVYRLTSVPPAPADWMVWFLWSRGKDGNPQGVFARETALAIQGISPADPSIVHMIVPKKFRRNTPTPFRIRLYREDLDESDVETVSGVRVTRRLRTMADLRAAGVRIAYEEYPEDPRVSSGLVAASARAVRPPPRRPSSVFMWED